jgi:hypothetical protein
MELSKQKLEPYALWGVLALGLAGALFIGATQPAYPSTGNEPNIQKNQPCGDKTSVPDKPASTEHR